MSGFEAHITLDPFIDDDHRNLVASKGKAYGFRVAKLYKANGVTQDAFCTAFSVCRNDLTLRLIGFVKSLQSVGFKIKRYKIEEIVLDSRIIDALELLQ